MIASEGCSIADIVVNVNCSLQASSGLDYSRGIISIIIIISMIAITINIIKASSGLDYSRGTKRVPPGVSKLGRTPRRNQGPRQEIGEPEGRMAFLG